MWDPYQIHLLRVYPLWGTTRRLTHRPVSDSYTICNSLDPPPADIVLFKRGFLFYPLRGTTRRLIHRPVSSSDTICNNPDPLRADIVFFKMGLLGKVSTPLSRMFRFPPQPIWDIIIHHPLHGPAFSLALVPFSSRCGTPTKFTSCVSNPFGEQREGWHIRCLALIPFVTAQTPC